MSDSSKTWVCITCKKSGTNEELVEGTSPFVASLVCPHCGATVLDASEAGDAKGLEYEPILN